MLREKFNELLDKTVEALKKHYNERLISVVLFGSVARKKHRPDSDIDLLIVVENLPKSRLKRIEEFDKVEEEVDPLIGRLRKEGIFTSLSPIIRAPEEIRQGSFLFLDLIEDGRILFDRNDFFKDYIHNLREKLKLIDAKRVWLGSAWYWIIKSHTKSGKNIDL